MKTISDLLQDKDDFVTFQSYSSVTVVIKPAILANKHLRRKCWLQMDLVMSAELIRVKSTDRFSLRLCPKLLYPYLMLGPIVAGADIKNFEYNCVCFVGKN